MRTPEFDPDGELIPFIDDVLDDLLDIDPRGEVFRYPRAKSGAWYLHDRSLINLRILYDVVERTRETFDSWNFTAGVLWDQQCAAL